METTHYYEINGQTYPNRLAVKQALHIGDKLFARLIKNGIIKKIKK